MNLFDTAIIKGARFSDCRLYRYQLWRIWDEGRPYLNVIGLNPSTADETRDDPTIRRCIDYAKRWNYGGLFMTNIFAFRATLPAVMKKQVEPVGSDNDHWLIETAANALNAGAVQTGCGKAQYEYNPDRSSKYEFRFQPKLEFKKNCPSVTIGVDPYWGDVASVVKEGN